MWTIGKNMDEETGKRDILSTNKLKLQTIPLSKERQGENKLFSHLRKEK